jgi:uncharacterized protein (TIGR02444 family)
LSLWDDVGAVYARPGVEALCLALQDDHGQCVSFLLWAGWAAQAGRFPDGAGLDEAAALARTVEEAVLRPLRAARRGLKHAGPGAAAAVALAAELDAERRLLEALEQAAPAAGPPVDVAAGLAAAIGAWAGRPLSAEQVQALASAFSPR